MTTKTKLIIGLIIAIIIALLWQAKNNQLQMNNSLDSEYQQVIQYSTNRTQDTYWKNSWNPGGIIEIQDAPKEINEKYARIWKKLFMKKNSIIDGYFNRHIEIIDTGISTDQTRFIAMGGSANEKRERGREYFEILYKIKFGWIEFDTKDRFAIRNENSEVYLTQPEIEENMNAKGTFQDSITNIAKFYPLENPNITFKEAVQKLQQVNLPYSEYIKPIFLGLDRNNGGIILYGIGKISDNGCIQGYFNFLTGIGRTDEIPCSIE